MMERIIVTGATGYIGSNLVNRLKEKYEVFVIARNTSSLDSFNNIVGQFDAGHILRISGATDELVDFFHRVKPDYVIHCATLFISEHKTDDIERLINSNILFFTQVVEATAKSGCKKIINTSTSWQYYGIDQDTSSSLYAATKKGAEQILKYYADAYSICSVNLTIFDSYGPKDPRKKIVNLLCDISRTGESLDMSGGEQLLELVYIDDITNAYEKTLLWMKKNNPGMYTFFIHSNKRYSLREVAKTVESVSQRKLHINWGVRPYRNREIMIPYNGGEKVPEWCAKVGLHEGIEKMLH